MSSRDAAETLCCRQAIWFHHRNNPRPNTDDVVQRVAGGIARRGNRYGVGGADEADPLHADDFAAVPVAQEIA